MPRAMSSSPVTSPPCPRRAVARAPVKRSTNVGGGGVAFFWAGARFAPLRGLVVVATVATTVPAASLPTLGTSATGGADRTVPGTLRSSAVALADRAVRGAAGGDDGAPELGAAALA